MSDEFLPLVVAARHLGVSRPTLSKLVKAGEIPVYQSRLNRRLKLLAVTDLERLRRPQAKERLVA